jgi:hypothetical protein
MKLKTLVTEIKKKGTHKKNGFKYVSVEEFMRQELTEAPIGSYKTMSDDDLQPYLKRAKDKTRLPKDKLNMPYVHNAKLKFKDESGTEIDTDDLRKNIMVRPSPILRKNEKMKHSDGTEEQYYNIGLPALRGLAVDESTGEFIIVNTCPGAGKCMLTCYAMKGNYIMVPDSAQFRSRMLNFIVNDPDGFKAQLMREVGNKHKTSQRTGEIVAIRWHDAGDFFSPDYLQIAIDVANAFPTVNFYAYTKVAGVMANNLPPNLDPRFSDGAKNSDTVQIDFKKERSGRIVPTDLFADLRVSKRGKDSKDDTGRWAFTDLNELKSRIADYYDVDINTIVMDVDYTTMNKNQQENQWNVIVVPGGSDAPANDKNNLNVFNLEH